jgi:putative salt-induced outer membrane protein YdiY
MRRAGRSISSRIVPRASTGFPLVLPIALLFVCVVASAAPVRAQSASDTSARVADLLRAAPLPVPSPPPAPRVPLWGGSIGLGLAVTAGNADTSTFNVSIDVATRARSRNVFKADLLYLRGDENGELNVNRLSVKARDEYTRAPRAFVFGQVEYLRDTFKDLQFLIAPTVGVGFKVRDRPGLVFAVDAGIGAKAEKSPYRAVAGSGAFSAAQRFQRALSKSAAVTQSVTALWTLDRFDDALYTVKLGLTAAITSRAQLKVELVDFYKTRPPVRTVVRNDVSAVTAVVYKF